MQKVSMHIEKEDWLYIQRYYLANSPLILPQPPAKNKIKWGDFFRKANFLDTVPGATPMVTMIKNDHERNVLYTGDVSGNLFVFNHVEFADKIEIDNIPIDVEFLPEEKKLDVSGMGSLMPSDARTGQLIRIGSEARDFDSDGDLDIVVLAMYPDPFSWEEEALVHFENLGDLNFVPTYLEREPSGKWLLMDAGDIDGEGDEDLVVGKNIRIRSVLLPAKFKAVWSNSKTSYSVFTNNLISY